jgi:hypothetical protein
MARATCHPHFNSDFWRHYMENEPLVDSLIANFKQARRLPASASAKLLYMTIIPYVHNALVDFVRRSNRISTTRPRSTPS